MGCQRLWDVMAEVLPMQGRKILIHDKGTGGAIWADDMFKSLLPHICEDFILVRVLPSLSKHSLISVQRQLTARTSMQIVLEEGVSN